MKKFNSVKHAVQLAQILPADDELFKNRSDEWWDSFWLQMGLASEAGCKGQRLQEVFAGYVA